jgi:hypothetical protein
MPHPLVSFLDETSDAYDLTPKDEILRTLALSPMQELLPRPYKIYGLDETQPPISGFPVSRSGVIEQLEEKLELWIAREIDSILGSEDAREQAQEEFRAYSRYLLKIVENAMLSNFLADYHGIFWLVHSEQLARHFAGIPDALAKRDRGFSATKGGAMLYRIYNRWSTTMRRGMEQMAERLHPMLEGEEKRNLEVFEILQKNVLIFTSPSISRDLRELRAYVTSFLREDADEFLSSLDRILEHAATLATTGPSFQYTLQWVSKSSDEIRIGRESLLDGRVREFLLHHPEIAPLVDGHVRTVLTALYARIVEWDLLRRLRAGIVWMERNDRGEIVSTEDERIFSRSTRPIDFGRVGVLDPIAHRFGLVYDLSHFSQTLAEIARGGVRKEINSYRQMFLFQKKLDEITSRQGLKFEKFLGDGAFYTSRRALRLVNAAIEMQRLYGELKERGFVFDRGLRIALNYGYYRLLPLGSRNEANQPLVEFYGPGIVELSRLTTGKSAQALTEVQQYLLSRGYDENDVHRFFAPVMKTANGTRGEQSHEREFFAQLDHNGNLVNEGIVAPLSLLEQLTLELQEAEMNELLAIDCPWGRYVGFDTGLEGVAAVGVRMLGQVTLKGMNQIEVAEIVRFEKGDCRIEPILNPEGLLPRMRQLYLDEMQDIDGAEAAEPERMDRAVPEEGIALCSVGSSEDSVVTLGRWKRHADVLEHPVRLTGSDLQQLMGIELPLQMSSVESRKHSLCDLYRKLAEHENDPPVPLDPLRRRPQFQAFLLGTEVEEIP